jgi:hypothetical protein
VIDGFDFNIDFKLVGACFPAAEPGHAFDQIPHHPQNSYTL